MASNQSLLSKQKREGEKEQATSFSWKMGFFYSHVSYAPNESDFHRIKIIFPFIPRLKHGTPEICWFLFLFSLFCIFHPFYSILSILFSDYIPLSTFFMVFIGFNQNIFNTFSISERKKLGAQLFGTRIHIKHQSPLFKKKKLRQKKIRENPNSNKKSSISDVVFTVCAEKYSKIKKETLIWVYFLLLYRSFVRFLFCFRI